MQHRLGPLGWLLIIAVVAGHVVLFRYVSNAHLVGMPLLMILIAVGALKVFLLHRRP